MLTLPCSNCSGKGHVPDVFMIIATSLFAGLGIILYFMQRKQEGGVLGVTRETCCQCNGGRKLLNN